MYFIRIKTFRNNTLMDEHAIFHTEAQPTGEAIGFKPPIKKLFERIKMCSEMLSSNFFFVIIKYFI